MPPTLAGLKRTSFGQYDANVFSDIFKPAIVALYKMCGAVAGAEADYGQEHVILVDTGRAANALCVLGNEKTLDGKPIDQATVPQGSGYSRPGHTFAWRGRYYLRVVGSKNSFGGGTNALALTLSILAELPNPATPDPDIEALRALPMIGRIPGSDRYLPQGVFSFTALQRGFAADYGCGETGLSIAHIALPQGATAQQIATQLKTEATGGGYRSAAESLGDESYSLTKSGKPVVHVIRVGNTLAAIEADGDINACAHIPRELVQVLRR